MQTVRNFVAPEGKTHYGNMGMRFHFDKINNIEIFLVARETAEYEAVLPSGKTITSPSYSIVKRQVLNYQGYAIPQKAVILKWPG